MKPRPNLPLEFISHHHLFLDHHLDFIRFLIQVHEQLLRDVFLVKDGFLERITAKTVREYERVDSTLDLT
jgi:hypothetical protein